MKYRFEKNMRILGDLIAYCYQQGALDFDMKMNFGKEQSTFEIVAPTKHMTEMELAHLRKMLHYPRQHEMEQNYWGLSGEPETDPELMLVGMMVDEAEVTFEEDLLRIRVWRKEST